MDVFHGNWFRYDDCHTYLCLRYLGRRAPQSFIVAFRFAPFPFILLVYISCQAILSSRVYALYGNKRSHLIGFIFLCCVVPIVVLAAELHFSIIVFNPVLLLYTYNILGLLTDALLLALILAHAVRNRPILRIRFPMQEASVSISVKRITASGTSLLSLVVSDSIMYYTFTLTMYVVSFILARTYVEGQSDSAAPMDALGNTIRHNTADALVTLMTVLTSILAPKLLLSIRKQVYISADLDQNSSASQARRTITWRVARPSGNTETSELSSSQYSEAEPCRDITSESASQEDVASSIGSGCELARNSESGVHQEM